jgi:hypothetical protein
VHVLQAQTRALALAFSSLRACCSSIVGIGILACSSPISRPCVAASIRFDSLPVFDRQLAGDDDGAAIVPVIDDLQEVAALLGREWGQAPVVEDQEFDACERAQQAGMAAVASRKSKRAEQSGRTLIEHAAVGMCSGMVVRRFFNCERTWLATRLPL